MGEGPLKVLGLGRNDKTESSSSNLAAVDYASIDSILNPPTYPIVWALAPAVHGFKAEPLSCAPCQTMGLTSL